MVVLVSIRVVAVIVLVPNVNWKEGIPGRQERDWMEAWSFHRIWSVYRMVRKSDFKKWIVRA